MTRRVLAITLIGTDGGGKSEDIYGTTINMPGKYSYGVVLGDLSTRGVISLPQEQHDRYTQQVPSTRQTVHELRLRGTQSAAGDYRRIVGTSSRFNKPSGHRFETLLQPVQPQGNGRLNIRADDQSKRDEAWRSKYTEIIPWSEPPEETTVTQQTPSNSSSQNRSEAANRIQRPGMSQRPATGVKTASKIVSSFRATRSDNNLRRPVQNGVENYCSSDGHATTKVTGTCSCNSRSKCSTTSILSASK